MNEIINWEYVHKQSSFFQNASPAKFAFVENVFDQDFYNKLYSTYPKFDDGTWEDGSTLEKAQLIRGWGKYHYSDEIGDEDDPKLSKDWNLFFHYLHSKEFIDNFVKFTGIPFTKVKTFRFVGYRRGGFQTTHTHDIGRILIVFFYFSKGWKKGDPGGTYVASEEDESSIIFEPHTLDNSMVVLLDGPHSYHGTRYISKDVERRAIQLYLE